MDGARFDALARALAVGGSRRAALRGLATALAALGLGGPDAEDAAAARCSKTRPCPPCRRCRRGRCKASADASRCATDQVCFRGACCTPDCAAKACGPDGCGGSCGPCLRDNAGDGRTDSERCVGGRCVTWRGNCPAGADSCNDGAVSCNDSDLCRCYQSFAGDTRCGLRSDGAGGCFACTGDADCDIASGEFCAVDGPFCPCDEGKARCIQPC